MNVARVARPDVTSRIRGLAAPPGGVEQDDKIGQDNVVADVDMLGVDGESVVACVVDKIVAWVVA